MITFENTEVFGWEAAIRGMRNPMNSWDKSDSDIVCEFGNVTDKTDFSECMNRCVIGTNDLDLIMRLVKAGPEHAKFRRMINVTVDITAPLYWWKEFETYKVGTVCNSCSTMHKIHDKEFTLDDFSHEHLEPLSNDTFIKVIEILNYYRDLYNKTIKSDSSYDLKTARNAWWQMIQLLPSSYNQRRTVQFNYEVLANIYRQRKGHKLDEWNEFIKWIETLPYADYIIYTDSGRV